MLPGSFMRQIYAGNTPCGEMRNTKQMVLYTRISGATEICVPGLLHARILYLLALRKLRYKVSGCWICHGNFTQISRIDSQRFYVIVIRDFRYSVIGWLG